jgi:uncharacterized Ntn-hydrolase superfamily protein
MTWSLVAVDKDSGAIGVAVASKFFSVGAKVPHVASRIGGIATQALVNPFFGTEGLRLLAGGLSPGETVARLTTADAGRDHRQLHIVDGQGRGAAFTGSACIEWCGHMTSEGFSVAGNMLDGPRVIEETVATYEASADLPFPRRLIAALKAGEATGGDKRGKQAAALVIYREEDWPDLDLRVDDHPEPIVELERLERVSRERFVHFCKFLPNRRDPVGVTDRTAIDAGIADMVAAERSAEERS